MVGPKAAAVATALSTLLSRTDGRAMQAAVSTNNADCPLLTPESCFPVCSLGWLKAGKGPDCTCSAVACGEHLLQRRKCVEENMG